MRIKIFSRIFVSFIVLTSVLLITLGSFSVKVIQEHFYKQQRHHLQSLTKLVAENSALLMSTYDQNEFDNHIKNFVRDNSERITIIDSKGFVFADSDLDPKRMENHKLRPEIIKASKTGEGFSERFSNSVENSMLYYAKKIIIDNETWFIRVSSFSNDYNLMMNRLSSDVMKAVFVVILLAIFSAVIISRSISIPITHLVNTAKKISDGNFDVSFYPFPVYEVEELNKVFQTMIEKISQLVSELSKREEALAKVIKHIREPLIVVSQSGDVILQNKAFSQINNSDVNESNYLKAIKHSEILDFISGNLQGKRDKFRDIALGEYHFNCRVSKIHSAKQFVFLFYDVTELKKLELIKKQFISNVSHELRTPLTSIKGFTETLLDELNEEQKYYLKIIARNTDRMILMVNDLLSLSQLEQTNMKLSYENVNLFNLINNVKSSVMPRIEEKHLLLKISCPIELNLDADPFKLEQVLINLIENAIRYTDHGEISIKVSQENDSIIIKLEDTGIGIEENHLERIFERFYVVDKSRSKKVGGTGLGLSIVKHIISLHGAKISVKSQRGKGSCFTMVFQGKQID